MAFMRIRPLRKWDPNHLAAMAWVLIRAICHTTRIRLVNAEGVFERQKRGEGQVLVTWHGRTLIPLFVFRGRGLVTIISPSRDGEAQFRLYRRFGWEAVRGSTGRNGARAALGAVRRLQAGATLAVAPDGPRGPSGVAQPGSLYLARKAGCPVIPAGVSASPAWRLRSWDSFQVPKPFSRATIVFGEPTYVPTDPTEEELAELADALGREIDRLQAEADALAGCGGALPVSPRQGMPNL